MTTVVSSLVLILESTVMCSMGYSINTWQWWAMIFAHYIICVYSDGFTLFGGLKCRNK